MIIVRLVLKRFQHIVQVRYLKKCLKILSIERPTCGAKSPSSDFCVGFLKHNEKEHIEKDNDKT